MPFAARLVTVTLPAAILVLDAGTVCGQDYPTRPIRIIANEAGSGSDFSARLITPGLGDGLGQTMVIENRGGSVVIVAEFVSRAPPDGYTLLINAGTLWQTPLLQATPYDPIKDFSPIAILTKVPSVLVVHPSMPVKSVQELVALANARPGAINYASGSAGNTNHLAGELFKALARVNIVNVPYKSGGSAINALLSGEVQLTFAPVGLVAPHIRSGRMRALAVASTQPSPLLPGLPTIASAGLPGYEQVIVSGMFAPARTPASIINRINQEIVRSLARPDVKERFFNASIETVGSSPQELAAWLKSDMAVWGKVIKDAGIRID